MLTAFAWIGSNIKYLAIIISVILIAGFLYKGYAIITENIQNQSRIVTLETTLKYKDWLIQGFESDRKLTEKLISDRDLKLRELEEQLALIVKDLPADADKDAPDSIREYFKRLKEMNK